MGVGVLLNLACIAVALTGVELHQFAVALFLLGVGWNFLFTGSTTLSLGAYRPEEKDRAQAPVVPRHCRRWWAAAPTWCQARLNTPSICSSKANPCGPLCCKVPRRRLCWESTPRRSPTSKPLRISKAKRWGCRHLAVRPT
jgi:hypothetical protein